MQEDENNATINWKNFAACRKQPSAEIPKSGLQHEKSDWIRSVPDFSAALQTLSNPSPAGFSQETNIYPQQFSTDNQNNLLQYKENHDFSYISESQKILHD